MLRPWLVLTKARLSVLVLWTTAVGALLAWQTHLPGTPLDTARFIGTMIGTALSAACANALNQVLEIRRDALMNRTAQRPLPRGVLSRRWATIVALLLGIGGIALLARTAGESPAILAGITIAIYVAGYTPLKTRSTLNTLVGAVCGAIPPMIGWNAMTGGLETGAWILGALLFIWQIPHFLALAWLFRDDYERGGFVMLPRIDESGRLTGRIVLITTLLLTPLALTATLTGLAGWLYTAGTLALGLWMFRCAWQMHRQHTSLAARGVFRASLVYLSALLLLIVIDRGPIVESAAVAASVEAARDP